MRSRTQRPTLNQSLDKEVYQVICKFVDEQNRTTQTPPKLSVHIIYNHIKQSKSSLNRRSKKLLEDSIDRALAVLNHDLESDDEASFEEDFEDTAVVLPRDSNIMNRSITGIWSTDHSSMADTTLQRTSASQGLAVANVQAQSPKLENSHGRILPSKKRELEMSKDVVSKRRKDGHREVDRSPPTRINLADLGGVDEVVRELTELVALPMLYPEIYRSSGIQHPRGILLHGPPGCGKTMIAHAFASEIGVSFIPVSAPSIVSGMSGESEKKLRDCFGEARRLAPCLMFIDEIDAITPKRESAQREMEKRIVAQMLTCMDDLNLEQTDAKPVIIIAATNRPDSLDPALRRAGRFNKEINMNIPDAKAREKILIALTQKLRLDSDINFKAISRQTAGFVGADLHDLVSTAGVAATKRAFQILQREAEVDPSSGKMIEEQNSLDSSVSPSLLSLRQLIAHSGDILSASSLSTLSLTALDFSTALPKIQPSAKREGFATIPDTTWADIGALHGVRDELTMAIIEPIARPERYAAVGITAPTGVLLWGPPGCGKTLLAKAVANESCANFISVKGPELLNKYVGESERAVRQVFLRARASVPCIVFFDELDALVPKRGADGLSEASARVVNTLLTELDGLSDRKGIYVIAATNRPDIIDPAMLRPGRLGTLLFVDLPGPEERVEILRTLVKTRVEGDLDDIARRCKGFSGADLESLLRAAGIAALRRGDDTLKQQDFEVAVTKVHCSVVDIERYRRLRSAREWG